MRGFISKKVVDFEIAKREIINNINVGTLGGESGIRTRDALPDMFAFQANAFSHSAISPTVKEIKSSDGLRCSGIFLFPFNRFTAHYKYIWLQPLCQVKIETTFAHRLSAKVILDFMF